MFEGIVVLDVSQVFAGPLAARLLAEGGATVIKVERPPGGDVSRQLRYRKNDRSGYYVQQNRGKQSICLDLAEEQGRDVLWRLIDAADVLIDGFAPGALARLGFGFDIVAARNPRIIVCELSTLGRDGTASTVRGYDPIGACYAGVAYTAADTTGLPILPSVAMGDAMMGLSAFGGISAALFDRVRTDRGQRVDVSLVDSYIQAHSANLEVFSLSGGEGNYRTVGGQNATSCPVGPFLGPDGSYLFIACVSTDDWLRLCRCMRAEDLESDPGLRTAEGRVARRGDIVERIGAWLATRTSSAAALEELAAAGVVAAPVLSVGEAIHLPANRARGTVQIVSDRDLGEFAVPGPPIRYSGSTSPAQPLTAPALGEHSRHICTTYGGLSEAEVDQLFAAGVLTGDADPSSVGDEA